MAEMPTPQQFRRTISTEECRDEPIQTRNLKNSDGFLETQICACRSLSLLRQDLYRVLGRLRKLLFADLIGGDRQNCCREGREGARLEDHSLALVLPGVRGGGCG
jgi:hypothetical protein